MSSFPIQNHSIVIHETDITEVAAEALDPNRLEIQDIQKLLEKQCQNNPQEQNCEATYSQEQFQNLLQVLQGHKPMPEQTLVIPNVFTPNQFNVRTRLDENVGRTFQTAVYFTDSIGVWSEPEQVVPFVNQGVEFRSDFLGALMTYVTETGDDEFSIITNPESSSPINSSPWYAFAVGAIANREGNIQERSIRIHIEHGGFTTARSNNENAQKTTPIFFRYPPKISYDEGQTWQALPEDQVEYHYNDDGEILSATITLTVREKPVIISAQEIQNSQDIAQSIERFSALPFVTNETIGETLGGQAISLLTVNEGQTEKPTVVIIGGQHPPEVTGRLAQQAFFETLISDDPLAVEFRQHYNVKYVPAINLDGIDDGHWRFSRAGVDLNRDWQTFVQPETQAVRDALLANQNLDVCFFLDFHSTQEDTFYLNKNPKGESDLDRKWYEAILESRENRGLDTSQIISKPLPHYTVPASMFWANETFETPAITYEVGDSTDRQLLKENAQIEAKLLMAMLLQE